MKTFIVAVLVCVVTTTSSSWLYPGYPGVDCPTAREKMLQQPDNQWMLPKCHDNGTFVDLQCFEKDPNVCMCVALDGAAITLPWFGAEPVTCVCFMAGYYIAVQDPEAEMPNCNKDGSYEPLQCDKASGECWCVDRNGKVLVPPSKDIHSCNN